MFINPYNNLYLFCKKAAAGQTENSAGPEAFFNRIDEEVDRLKAEGYLFLLGCNGKVYNLPFPLESIPYFRPLFAMATHRLLPEVQADDTHAVDFDIPLGSKVYAVEEGVVTAMANTNTAGGNNPDFAGLDNYLYIYNKEKNLMFCYRHLAPFNHIKLHQKIQKGTYLGDVGLTGYVITPHLHFAVYRYCPGKKIILKSLKIRFTGRDSRK